MGKETTRRFKVDLNSKFWRTLITMLAFSLTFAGPTYVVYVLYIILDVSYVTSMVFGFALFMLGLALIWYLIRNKVIA
ncbi:MAG: hypothetical protein QXI91_03495 [Candidatus Bathyarchaeia archaeon]